MTHVVLEEVRRLPGATLKRLHASASYRTADLERKMHKHFHGLTDQEREVLSRLGVDRYVESKILFLLNAALIDFIAFQLGDGMSREKLKKHFEIEQIDVVQEA